MNNINSRINNYLPKFVLESKILKDIFRAIIVESEELNKYLKNYIKEMNVTTAFQSIDKWENFAGVSNPNLNIEERIDSIIKKFSYQIHANYFNFLEMLKTYDDTTELKEIIDEYRIEIRTKNYISYDDFQNYLSIINNYKPAHIGVSIEVNREYVMNYYIGNISTNNKTVNIVTKIDSPKELNYNLLIGFVTLQDRHLDVKITNKISNNHCVKFSNNILVQRFKKLDICI